MVNSYRWPKRSQAYTLIGVHRLPCCGCGERSEAQARCCADGNWRPFCVICHEMGIAEMLSLLDIPEDPRGRQKPYADYGLYRTPCVRCGQRSRYQWTVGKGFRPVCPDCDVLMNELALRQMGHPRAVELLCAYRQRVENERHEVPVAARRSHAAPP